MSDQKQDGTAVITINAKIVNGKIDKDSMEFSHNMGQWSHAAFLLTAALDLVLREMTTSKEDKQAEQKPLLWVPTGPTGAMRQ